MDDADLLIVDANPRDPLDFLLDRYQAQLVADSSRDGPAKALIVTMPDYRTVAMRHGTVAAGDQKPR